jgi:hypothetical protein
VVLVVFEDFLVVVEMSRHIRIQSKDPRDISSEGYKVKQNVGIMGRSGEDEVTRGLEEKVKAWMT